MKKYYLILGLVGLVAACVTVGALFGAASIGTKGAGIVCLVVAFIAFTATVTSFATIGFLALNQLKQAKKENDRN